MHAMIKKTWVFILLLAMLVLAAGCATSTGEQKMDFSGVWEGVITLEGMHMPGKMVLDLKSNGNGSARFGFVDQRTQGSIEVMLDKENTLKGEGVADEMFFSLDGKFYELEDEWVFSGNLIIEEDYEKSHASVEFFREGSAKIPDTEELLSETVYMQEDSPEIWGNSIDFSGEWTGFQLLAEVSGPNAQQYKDMEGLTVGCLMVLELPDFKTGTADLYFADELTGPALIAVAEYDRLTLTGSLWGDPFEWSGTFEYDEAVGEWTLTGGGDIKDTTENAIFHIVLSMNQSGADAAVSQQQPSGSYSQELSTDMPLEQFMVGSWMRESSNVMVERSVYIFNADGTAMSFYATPGPGDMEATWTTGSWEKDEPNIGSWRIDGDKLSVEFENDLISFESIVQMIDENTIAFNNSFNINEYYRLP